MFNGRITEVGTVHVGPASLTVEAPKTAATLSEGGSVCVNGVCLSVTAIADGRFTTDISAETARRSTLGDLRPGAQVNLEVPLSVGDHLDGHLVQGHVDAVGKVTRVDSDEADGGHRVWIRPPQRFLDEVVGKASVAVDGVSLTVAEVRQRQVLRGADPDHPAGDHSRHAIGRRPGQSRIRPLRQDRRGSARLGPDGRDPIAGGAALGGRAPGTGGGREVRGPAGGRWRRAHLRPRPARPRPTLSMPAPVCGPRRWSSSSPPRAAIPPSPATGPASTASRSPPCRGRAIGTAPPYHIPVDLAAGHRHGRIGARPGGDHPPPRPPRGAARRTSCGRATCSRSPAGPGV